MKHHKISADQYIDTTLREIAAKTDLAALTTRLIAQNWAVDTNTTPGALTAAKGNARIHYPGGTNGQWDPVIAEMRPADGLRPHDPLTADLTEAPAWWTTVSQSAPIDVILGIAEMAAGDAGLVVDDIRSIVDQDARDFRDAPTGDDPDGEDCTGR